MYWCKLKVKSVAIVIFGVMLLTCGIACKPGIKNNGAFDLKGFMTKDTARLKKLNRFVIKTVVHNGVSETKKVQIADWGKELGLFIDADINKPGWKNSYTVIDEDSLLIYRAKDDPQHPKLIVRYLIIKKGRQKVKSILIYTKAKNVLYQSTQRLTYFPDSLYEIITEQKVKLLQKNVYKIRGIIIK